MTVLTQPGALPRQTLAALQARDPDRVTIVGDTRAVDVGIESDLVAAGHSVRRLAGNDRYATAAGIALDGAASHLEGELDGLSTAIVASGENFPDALAAATVAYRGRFPLLLTQRDELPADTVDALAELGVEQVIVAGGEAAVSAAVADQLDRNGYRVRRVAGASRTATAVAFARLALDEGLALDVPRVHLVRGDLFPDALALAPLAGLDGGILLLTAGPDDLGAETRGLLTDLADPDARLRVAGGPKAVSYALEAEAREALTPDDGVALPERGPVLVITSPVAGSVTPGAGVPGAGSLEGAGFVINLEARTRDTVGIRVNEALNIRRVDLLGQANPSFPGLDVRVDTDLLTPDGATIPAGSNLAALFNVAGVDDSPGRGVTVWAGWHVLESLPADVETFTISASVADDAGRVATDAVTVDVDRDGPASGQALTPAPVAELTGGDGVTDPDGPRVRLLAPRRGTSLPTGPAGTPVPPAGALFFLQVEALDRAGAGIGVSENGPGNGPGQVNAIGSILDAPQIAAGGPNRNYPGLEVTFDVPLRQPNGNLVPAGANLAPLFNIAGSEPSAAGVLTTADWVVGGSLEPTAGVSAVTVTVKVTDAAGRSGSDRATLPFSATANGQALTPTP